MGYARSSLEGEKLRETLRENLRRFRVKKGCSQEEISLLLGVTRATYTYYETGKTTPSVIDLYWLAQFYGCTMEAFLTAETGDGKGEEA